MPAGVFRVDGVSIDPTVDKPNGDYQLLDIKTGAQQGQSPGIGDGGWLVEGLFSHDLPYPGVKPVSLTSSELAGGFFTT